MKQSKKLKMGERQFQFRLLADLHFHEFTEFASVKSDGTNTRLTTQVDALEHLMRHEGEHGRPRYLFVAGDLVHKHGILTAQVQWALQEFFTVATELYEQVHVIPGNHDYALKSEGGWLYSFLAFKYENVFIHHEATVVETYTEGRSVAFAPWLRGREKFRESVAWVANQGADFLISHVAVEGFKTDNGWTYENGISVSDLQPDKFKMVFLGDFHTRQRNGNVMYIGAPYQMNWGDMGDDSRGALDVLVQGEDVIVTSIDSPAPQFFKVETLKEAQKLQTEGHFVKLVAGSGSNLVSKASAAGVTVEVLPPEPPPQRLNVEPDWHVMEILGRYLDTLPEDYELDKSLLRQVCSEVVGAVDKLSLQRASNNTEFRVLEIEAQNFLSYEKLGPLVLDGRGVVLVDGVNRDDPDANSNGSGKSALIEALFYCLYGKTLRDMPVAEIVKRGSKGGAFVRVKAVVRGGQEIVITRSRKMKDRPDGLGIEIDGNAVQSVDLQADLLEMTGLPAALFSQVVIFGQEVSNVFASATDSERKALLENLCSGGQFEPVYAQAVIALNECAEAVNVVEGNLSRAIQKRADISLYLEEAKAREARYSEEVKSELEKSEALVADYRKRLQDAKDFRDHQMDVIEELEEKLSAFEEISERGLWDELDRLQIEENDLKVEGRQVGDEIHRLSTRRAKLQDLENSQCPNCFQKVEGETVARLVQEIDVAHAEQLEKQERIVTSLREVVEQLEVARKRRDELRERKSEFTAVQRNYDHAVHLRDNFRRDIAAIESQLEGTLKTIADLKNPAANPHTESVEQFEQSLALIESKISSMEERCEDAKSLLPYFKECSRLFGNQGLKTFLFDSLAPRITQLANEALQVLSSGTLSVEMTTERRASGEKISFKVNNALGAASYKGNSGGQKRKVDLAMCWAISQLVESKVNLLVIDEAFDALDSTAGERVSQLLNQRVGSRGTILVITHRSEFRESFENIWTATRSGGNSVLSES